MSINYNCRFKKYSENKRDYISKKDNEDYYKTDSVSTNLIKCMNKLIKKGALANAALGTGILLIIIEVILFVYYLFHNSSMFYNLLLPLMMIASPPRFKNIIDDDDSSDDSYDHPRNNNNNKQAPPPTSHKVEIEIKDNENFNQDSQIIEKSNIENKSIDVNNIIYKQENSNNNIERKNKSKDVNHVYLHKDSIREGAIVPVNAEYDVNENEIIDRYIFNEKNDNNNSNKSKKLCIRPILNEKKFKYSFEESKIKKNSFFWDYYLNLLLYNHMFLFVITKEKWNFFITKLSLFINLIFFLMLFNSLFIDENLFNELNKNGMQLCIGKVMGRIIASVILTILANFFLKLLALLRMEFEGGNWINKINNNINEKPHGISRYLHNNQNNENRNSIENNDNGNSIQNNDNGNSIQNNINRNNLESDILYYYDKKISKSTLKIHIFLRTFFYFIISIFLSLFISFYIAAFTGMYKRIRKNLFFYIIISFILIMLYPFVLCFIVTIFRYYGIKKNKKFYFNISKTLEWIMLI